MAADSWVSALDHVVYLFKLIPDTEHADVSPRLIEKYSASVIIKVLV